MMARRLLGAFLASALLALSLAPAQAQDTPTEYAFDVTKIELCGDSACSAAVVLGEGSQRFDLAAVGAGQTAGSFLSDFSLAANQTYTHLRVTHARAITMTATAAAINSGNGDDCVTTGAGILTASATTQARSEVDTTGGAAAASQVFVVPDTTAANAPAGLADTYTAEGIVLLDATTMTITKALTSPFTSGSSVPSIDAAFDVANTITFVQSAADACFAILGPPSVTITIQ